MTKREEIDAVKSFVASLPRDSYARDALEPFLMEFEQDVYSDYVPSVSQSWQYRREAEKETAEARAELKAVQEEIKAAGRRYNLYCQSVGHLERKARELRGQLDSCIESLAELAEASTVRIG
jgi:hypothetical protein